ncbi:MULTISPECIES: serine/threonine protein kinase [unclassified Corallococcus]|uniref:serine/threonine protein kinase n=1 Tax=unclassified Corallococcus TaxID=2685029 RepID=UPI001A8C96F0|nr:MULTISPECIES: serine/threonine protein kinase [unclassified Corallococcus]MBN9684949.1 protein kinase [Corallococcus sp. NCSPR001]WAS83591.1 protein kinase [Corallococcus sp. NCRR]
MTRSADGELHIDSVLRNTYKVVSVLGRGGMGSVFLAQHLRLPGKQVAVKVLRVGDHVGPDLHVRFRREAEIASRLGHPNIVEVLDFDTLEDGSPFLVLEYLRGESLADRLRRGRLSLEEVFSFTRQMGSALQTAHRAGVVHRDLKPANIFLVPTDSGGVVGERVKLLDFGISKVMSSETLQTQEAVLIGTPQYMSPEQAQGQNSRIDARTDLFALGGIVFEMISGMTPFGGGSLAQIIYRVVHEPPVSLATLMPDLPPNVAAAVARALEKKPENRHPDVASFIAELTGTQLQSLPETAEQIEARTFGRSKRPSGVALPSVAPSDDDGTGATMAPSNKGLGTGRFGADALAASDDIGFDATMAPRAGGTVPFGQQPQVAGGTMGFGATQAPGSGMGSSGVALPVPGAPERLQGSMGGQQAAPGYGTGQYGMPGSQAAPGPGAGPQAVPGSMSGQHATPASMGGQQVAQGSYGGQQAVPGSFAGAAGPQGQPLAPVSMAGQPGPMPVPPRSRVLPIAGAAALILGAVGLGWWLRPPPPVGPPPGAVNAPPPSFPPPLNPPPVAAPPPTIAQTPTPPPVTPTTLSDTPVKVDAPVQPTAPGKTAVKTGGKAPISRIPLNPTDAVAVSKLEEAQAAVKDKDFETAVRMAQKSYATQNNLAAHYVAIQSRCETKDLAAVRSEAARIRGEKLPAALIAACQSKDIELE